MGPRLGTLLLAILFLVLFLLSSCTNYKQRFNKTYNFRNMFPYELNYQLKFKENGVGNVCMLLMTICLVAFFATFDLTFGFSGIYIPTLVVGVIAAALIPFIILVPLMNLKAHLVFDVLLIGACIVLPATIGVAAFRDYQNFAGGTKSLIVTILCLVCCLIIAVFAINPKLSLRIEMDKKYNEKGEVEYVRPKKIPLAFTEWFLVGSIFVNAILVFVEML